MPQCDVIELSRFGDSLRSALVDDNFFQSIGTSNGVSAELALSHSMKR